MAEVTTQTSSATKAAESPAGKVEASPVVNVEAISPAKVETNSDVKVESTPETTVEEIPDMNVKATTCTNTEPTSATKDAAIPATDIEATPTEKAGTPPAVSTQSNPAAHVISAPNAIPIPMFDEPPAPKPTTAKPVKNPVPLTTIAIPRVGIPELALHRRGNHWFLVSPRAYGMADGMKLFSRLNHLQPGDSAPDPPSSHPHLHPRFWMRNGMDWENEIFLINFDNIFNSDPEVFKDTGLRRKVKIFKKVGPANMEEEVEERLVEVLLREQQLSQRCAWCGVWEYSYSDSTRHQDTGKGKDGRPVYWCGECSRKPKPLSTYWWQDPGKLHDADYFNYKLP